MAANQVRLEYRGEVWRVNCLLAAREGRWSARFVAMFLKGDQARIPLGMPEDAKEIRDALKSGRPLPTWSERLTIEQMNPKAEGHR